MIVILTKTVTKFQIHLVQDIVHFDLIKRYLEILTSLSNCFFNSSLSLFKMSVYFCKSSAISSCSFFFSVEH